MLSNFKIETNVSGCVHKGSCVIKCKKLNYILCYIMYISIIFYGKNIFNLLKKKFFLLN